MLSLQYVNPSDLGPVDVATIGAAKKSIDFAAYALDDPRIVSALVARANAGVTIRVYLDRNELLASVSKTSSLSATPIGPLLRLANVTVMVKESTVLMHLKSYVVDGITLRDGSANFSTGGEELQDNSLILTDDAAAIAAFNTKFAQMWSRADNQSPANIVQQNPHVAFHASRHQH
jgi:phosphatidylserine/phosphatidylglycerophosphate/cardiolipin synthase-like enzyme